MGFQKKYAALRSKIWLWASVTIIIAMLAGSLWPLVPAETHASVYSAPARQDVSVAAEPVPADGEEQMQTNGMTIALSEGAEQPTAPAESAVTAGEPLDQETTDQLLDRLPPLEEEPGDQQDLRLPESSLPPPRTGATVNETFPPQETAEQGQPTEVGPLEVLRYAPEGRIPIAPFLNVTFNQPMVPLTTIEELSAAQVPVILTPEVPGVWRWLGAKTLSFEYASDQFDRFPMATAFTVEVPAGTESAVGGVLEQAVTWSFSTPPPTVAYSYPGYGPQPLDALIFVRFDQRVDPAAVLDTVTVAAGGRYFDVRLATQDEIDAHPTVKSLAEQSGEGRWMAFRAADLFPTDTTISVNIGPGTPSAEGPLLTKETQGFSFQTYAPLRIEQATCSYGGDSCPPFSPFYIRFNNPLDEAQFDASWIRVEPAIPGLTIEAINNTITLHGATAGRTTYTVTIDGALVDIFGQTLGRNETRTFTTTSAPQVLTGPQEQFITLDPSVQTPTFSVYSINYDRLRVRAYQVGPEQWADYLAYLRDDRRTDEQPEPPGEKVLSEIFTVEGEPDQLTESTIDLSDALGGETGHLIVMVDFPFSGLFGSRGRYNPVVLAWVQVTQIGLDAFTDSSRMMAWATALQDGAPLPDVELSLYPGGPDTVTGQDGVANLDLPGSDAFLLLGRQGEDLAILPRDVNWWNEEGWRTRSQGSDLIWYVFDDRQMYRPGEEVHVKGWIRRMEAGPQGDIALPDTGGAAVRYELMDAQGNRITDGVTDVNDLGGFNLRLDLPTSMNLGYTSLNLSTQNITAAGGERYYHSFQVQEFRRPEFEVSARIEGEGPFFVGDTAVAAVSAQYFAGGPLPNAEATWDVTAQAGNYSPPNWPDFIFGTWEPWWFYYDPWMSNGGGGGSVSYSGRTDAAGVHYLRMNFQEIAEPRPYTVMADARVMDVNRQTWGTSANLLVHPASLYVGLRSERTFVERGDPLEISLIATDLDGNAVEDRAIQVRAARLDWTYEEGDWREVEVDPQECTVASATEPVSCTFTTEMGGRYRITAQVQDPEGRTNQSQFIRWVSGGQRPPAREVEQEEVALVPDQESYQPGDTAEILVQSPFMPAEGLLTVSRSGFLYTERFTMDEATTTLRIPIEDAYIPNLHVKVDLVGSVQRLDDDGEPTEGLPPRPAYASGSLNLAVPPLNRTLDLTVTPQETELAPGAETALDLLVLDAAGAPVADAELAVVVVDEAILALTNYQLADPVATFYRNRNSDVSSIYGRASIVLADPAALADEVAGAANEIVARATAMPMAAAPMEEAAEADGMAMDAAAEAPAGAAGEEPGITLRSNFNPLATFAPSVRTDAEGKATVNVSLPDNLTRYRVMVVAVADGKFFGSGESNLTARLPLMVRPSAPRFLNFGDNFEMPVVLQNQTDTPMEVDVALRGNNIRFAEATGQRVQVPANDRVEVRFGATTENAGTMRMQIVAAAQTASGEVADAAALELPVYTPATTEAFATYGVVDEGAVVQPVAAPANVFPQFGGLEVNTSSTALQSLTDAVLYLTAYPFECSEQLASRILGVAALRDVLSAFKAEGLPAPEEMEAAVERDIQRLQGMQNWDGGWPIWRKGQESVPFYSIHAAHALVRAQMKGFDVPPEMLSMALDHLREIESYYPYWYGETTRHSLSAYALYVRALAGDVDVVKAGALYNEKPLERMSLEAVAWIWQVLSGNPAYATQVEEIRRHINNQAVETAGAANFITSYGDDAYLMLHSDRRTDGVILDALINDQPESDLIPKVVNGLLAHRTQGRWRNTQENVFILLALDRYFNTYEAQTPDFVARIWLGDTYAGEHAYVGRTTERRETRIPMAYLTDPDLGGGETQDLTIAKDGVGRLYYRLGLRYAPTDLELEPLDMGFVVQRTYEAVDDPDDLYRDEEGIWHVKAGARVRVRLTMVAQNRRYHVALVDRLPAGLEIINPSLAVAESLPDDPSDPAGDSWWWWGPWYQHQNLRDDRAEAFTSYLWDGVYDYSYVARATTPGVFVAPPAKAEEMYSPEVFGRSGSDLLVVE